MQEFFSFFYRCAAAREKTGENGTRGARSGGERTGVFAAAVIYPGRFAVFIAASKM